VTPCPHCRALARPEPSRFFGLRCAACAGPVLEGGAGDGALPHLVRAQRARAMAVGWTAAAAVLAGVATMGLALAVVVGAASRSAGLLFVAITAGAAAGVVAGARRASRGNADARAELEAARSAPAARQRDAA